MTPRADLWHILGMHGLRAIPFKVYLAIAFALVAAQALVLLAAGQPPICACGTVKLWHGIVRSAENSQHLTDWYTFSHLIHGLLFYCLLAFVAPRAPIGLRFVLAVGFEAGWEILENSPVIIERYRHTALAQGYFGDSVVNSVSDTCTMALGFLLARKLPTWSVIVLAIAIELCLAAIIRDNLTLNIIQLIHPFDAISRWQAGA
jgi:hypothetical protein